MKYWPRWLKVRIIGLIVGLIPPFLLLFGDKLFGGVEQFFNVLTKLLTPIVLILQLMPTETILNISPAILNIFPTTILKAIPIYGRIATLISPIFYLMIGVVIDSALGNIGQRKAVLDRKSLHVSEPDMVRALANRVTGSGIQNFFPTFFPAEKINVRTYKDAEERLSDYKTFNFDYTSKTNPLLEKELFGQLEKVLLAHGLMRAKKDPQISISINFFIGKKEQYTPPQTVTSTELKSVWNYGMIGWNVGGFASQVPVTSSTTMPGYTTTSYYSNIRLNFLNHAKLSKGAKLEIPPLIWLGEADSEGLDSDIRGIAPMMFSELTGEFPESSNKGPKRLLSRFCYGGLGLGFDHSDWRVIRYVEPFSVAAEHGIKAGDVLTEINGKETKNWPAFSRWHSKSPWNYYLEDPYFQNVLSNHGDLDVNVTVKKAENGKTVKIKMRPHSEDRYVSVLS